MKSKEFALTLMALAAIAMVSVLAWRHVTRPREDLCQVCLRGLHHGVNFRLELADGTDQTTCCPRCGMHYTLEHPGAVRRALATDFTSSEMIPGETASYVEGGDVAYCTLHDKPVQRQPQGISVREYDRCLPTVVAFRTRQAAEAYQTQHGGRVLDYAQAMESVRQR